MSECDHSNHLHKAHDSTIWQCMTCGKAVRDEAQEAYEEMQKRNKTSLEGAVRMFVAGPFDYTTYGADDGKPRAYIVPAAKMDALIAALTG